MQKLVSLLLFNFLMLEPAAHAQTWRDIYKCQSLVAGFETFFVQKSDGSPEETLEFQISTGTPLALEFWSLRQKTGVHLEQSLQFEGLFGRLGADPEGPVGDHEFLLYLTINRSGTGSLSVEGELDPIFCQPSF